MQLSKYPYLTKTKSLGTREIPPSVRVDAPEVTKSVTFNTLLNEICPQDPQREGGLDTKTNGLICSPLSVLGLVL